MLNSQLGLYTNEQLSVYTNRQLAELLSLDSKYITDRTVEDVERWRTLRDKGWWGMTVSERREWLGEIIPTPAASKGMYTHRDLNRVETAVGNITTRLRNRGYDVSNIVTKSNWTHADTFTVDEVTRYLGNISKLRSLFPMYPDTPLVPSADMKLNYKLANDIERILMDVETISESLISSQYCSGDLFVGEV